MSNINDIYNSSSLNSEEGGKINKISIIEEEKNELTNNSFRKPKIENNKFIAPDHKIIWKKTEEITFHFKTDIERVYLIIRCYDLLSLINNKGHYPTITTKGNDTWQVGNEFKGNIFGIFPFLARVEKSINLPEIKKIIWLFNIENKGYILIKVELFKVTADNTCVLLWKMKLENSEMIKEFEEKYKEAQTNTIFLKVEELLESEPINLFQYESAIINAKMVDIWNIITDFNKITAIAPNNNCVPNINIGNMKQGEKISTTILDNNELNEVDITLEYKENKPGWNKWMFIIIISCQITKKIPKQTVLFQLTKINNSECQLTFFTRFQESIDNKKFRDISKRKKYLLLSIKDYFENFYSPNF